MEVKEIKMFGFSHIVCHFGVVPIVFLLATSASFMAIGQMSCTEMLHQLGTQAMGRDSLNTFLNNK